MQHRQLRSNRIRPGRQTSPVQSLVAPVTPIPLPGVDEARPSLHQSRSKGAGGAYRKPSLGSSQVSFRQAQVMAAKTPLGHLALEEQTSHTTSLAEPSPLELQALEGRTSQQTSPKHPSAGFNQLDLAQLEQKMLKIEMLQKEMRELVRNKLPSTLAAKLAKNECKQEVDCKQSSDNNNNNNDNNNNNNTNTTTTNNNNNNNEPNNYNNNNKNSRESSLNSFDLDNDNPESEPDLDAESFGCFNPILGAESRHDQLEASLSLGNLGHKTMAIGISLGSLIQQHKMNKRGCR